MMLLKRAQSTLEYVLILVIMMGVFLGMSNYIKRGLQGRWKLGVDSLGDQYDPRVANSDIIETLIQNVETRVISVNDVNGFWTLRTDTTNSETTKSGFMAVGGY